jgi:hypothetical protein
MQGKQTVSRRSFVGRAAGGLAVAGGAFSLLLGRAMADPPGASHPPSPQDSDRDSGDPSGLGRAINRDSGTDPSRRLARPTVGSRPSVSCTDSDAAPPSGDRIGRGVRCRIRSPIIGRLTDRDPTDPPGHGRGQ